MFTIFHFFVAFPLFYIFRKKLKLIAFFLGTILPDLEGLYLISVAYRSCASLSRQEFMACTADYPSHFLLHSFLGAILIGIIIVFIFRIFSNRKYFDYSEKIVFLSTSLGVLTHLFVDLFFHKGADALSLFYPIKWQVSLTFLNFQWFWYVFAVFGFVIFIILVVIFNKKIWEK